jgi:hypothetical protein
MAIQTINGGSGVYWGNERAKLNSNFSELSSIDVSLDTRLDSVEATNVSLDTRLDTVEANKLNADGNLVEFQNYVIGDTIDKLSTVSVASGVLTLNLSVANVFSVTLTQNITSLVFSNQKALAGRCQTVLLRLIQDSTGGRTFNGGPSGFNTTPNAVTLLQMMRFDVETNWYMTTLWETP